MSLNLRVSTVSGGYFVAQAGVMSTIDEAIKMSNKLKHPDVYMGASGGSLVNFLSAVSKKSIQDMRYRISFLSPEIFVRSWWSKGFNFIPSFIAGFFKDGLYNKGVGSIELVKDMTKHIDFNQIPELWSLAFDIGEKDGTLFCSRNKDKTIFKNYLQYESYDEKGLEERIYVDGNLNDISAMIEASASIPGIRDDVDIGGKSYVDGGISSSTPYRFFTEAIYEYIQDNSEKKIQIQYILPMENTDPNVRNRSIEKRDVVEEINSKHWIAKTLENLRSITMSMITIDSQIVLESFLRVKGESKKNIQTRNYKNLTPLSLKSILEDFNDMDYLMFFWTTDVSVNITNFTKEKLLEKFDESLKGISMLVYYF